MADSWKDGGGSVPATPEPGKPRCGASLVTVTRSRSLLAQTGHRSVTMVRRYIRDANLFSDNAAAGLRL